MVVFFDKWYSSVKEKKPTLVRLRYYSMKRLGIRILANVWIPLYFKFSPKKKLNNSRKEGADTPRVIVSLTTFPARIQKIWIVIESILHQQYAPAKIILWLSIEQFPSVADLPASLLKLQARGLEICLVDGDLKSHKKYYYFLQEYPQDFLVTIDDDIIYPETLIGDLMAYHKKYPDAICCHRARQMVRNKKGIAPYTEWPELRLEKGPGVDVFQTSGGGTLYPPGSLHPEVLNKNVFTKYCFFADDIWLNCMSQMNNTLVVKTGYYSDCIPVIFWKTAHLSTINVDNKGNDLQLSAVRNYYIQNKGVDPFISFFTNNNTDTTVNKTNFKTV